MTSNYNNSVSVSAIDLIAQCRSVNYKAKKPGKSNNDELMRVKPSFSNRWVSMFDLGVDKIVHNRGAMPSVAILYSTESRWNDDNGLKHGDMIRIVTTGRNSRIVFIGFVTAIQPHFTGGSPQGQSYEGINYVISDIRWLMDRSIVISGQVGRTIDDFENYGQENQAAVDDAFSWFAGRRAVFNQDNLPNKDNELLRYGNFDIPIFGPSHRSGYWTIADIVKYLLSPLWLKNIDFVYIAGDPEQLPGFNAEDFNKIVYNVSLEGLSLNQALDYILRQVGYSYRWSYYPNGASSFVFYKMLEADKSSRSSIEHQVKHKLYAPDIGEDCYRAVERGKKMLWSAHLSKNIESTINLPLVYGSPAKYEFTAELIPAWKDADLVIPSSNPVMYEADLATSGNPEAYDYYKYYHSRGSLFKRDVGRLWCLNESGRYTGGDYNRGMPFDWTAVLGDDAVNILKRKNFGLWDRPLLPCLTKEKNSEDSVRYIVEFSFDGGSTWQKIPCGIRALKDQAGIYISEPNLAEIGDQSSAETSDSPWSGENLNLWTSLVVDKTAGGELATWKTKVRITACVQMDYRLYAYQLPTVKSGSPFNQFAIYDYSDKYYWKTRTTASVLANETLSLAADERKDYTEISSLAERLGQFGEDQSFSGDFMLDRLWLNNSAGYAEFEIGDVITDINGREHSLATNVANRSVYPEIVQIVHLAQMNKTRLITRDLRFSEVRPE